MLLNWIRTPLGPNVTFDKAFNQGAICNTLLHFWNTWGMEQNLPFDVDALLVFGKVVECRSLSKAATLLGIPKSTVSRKLSKLESDLGIKLLRKNTHQLTVTDLGEKIYAHGAKILTEANGVRALVESSKQEPQGELPVAMPVFVGIDYASRVGALFWSAIRTRDSTSDWSTTWSTRSGTASTWFSEPDPYRIRHLSPERSSALSCFSVQHRNSCGNWRTPSRFPPN